LRHNDPVSTGRRQRRRRLIKKLSETTDHSEGNFHFAANASVPPYSPFFPGAYHTAPAASSPSASPRGTSHRCRAKCSRSRRRKRQIVDAFFNAAFECRKTRLSY